MNSSSKTRRLGLSLLELAVVTAMLAVLTTSSMVVLRTAYTVWNRHEDDHQIRSSAMGVLRHVVRHSRQARAVMAISAASDNSGSLALLDENGQVWVWDHDASTDVVSFGPDSADNLLATQIDELSFTGIKVDGSTPTTELGMIHSIECRITVTVPRPSGSEQITSSCRAWLRSW
jgi:hypothetical protein